MTAPLKSLIKRDLRVRPRLRAVLDRAGEHFWQPVTLPDGQVVAMRDARFDRPDQDDGWEWFLVRQSRSFFDIGCNVGHVTLIAALDPDRQVVAVDPNLEALARAAELVCRNGASTNVRFVPGFVGARDDETIDFWTVGTGAAGSAYESHAVTASARGSSRSVTTLTLDTLASRVGVAPDLVKIDVEGAESEVLDGARATAAAHRPSFLIEMHSRPELPMTHNADLVLGWAAELGYDAWYLRDHTPLVEPEQIADRGRCHLLLLPTGSDYPTGLSEIPQRCSIFAAGSAEGAPLSVVDPSC